MPRWLEPQFPKLVSEAPTGSDWIHEVKFDGYRMQLRVEKKEATLRSRNGYDWSEKFPALVRDAAKLPDCIIDGELCAIDAAGKPDFAALISQMDPKRSGGLVLFAFDLLWFGREDLRSQTLLDRKARLETLIAGVSSRLRYSTHTAGDGPALWNAACSQELEGIVSKRGNATYQSGKGDSWRKTKCRPAQEVVVGGWTESRPGHFKALLAGVYERGKLRYIGKVGTGFSDRVLTPLYERLRKARRTRSPFAGEQPSSSNIIHFVEPEIVAEIAHAGFIEGELRQASFKGLRIDKSPTSVEREG
jgi:bifunctional non-homologous end joining protein LigD